MKEPFDSRFTVEEKCTEVNAIDVVRWSDHAFLAYADLRAKYCEAMVGTGPLSEDTEVDVMVYPTTDTLRAKGTEFTTISFTLPGRGWEVHAHVGRYTLVIEAVRKKEKTEVELIDELADDLEEALTYVPEYFKEKHQIGVKALAEYKKLKKQ
jgi:hypothetical protein